MWYGFDAQVAIFDEFAALLRVETGRMSEGESISTNEWLRRLDYYLEHAGGPLEQLVVLIGVCGPLQLRAARHWALALDMFSRLLAALGSCTPHPEHVSSVIDLAIGAAASRIPTFSMARARLPMW